MQRCSAEQELEIREGWLVTQGGIKGHRGSSSSLIQKPNWSELSGSIFQGLKKTKMGPGPVGSRRAKIVGSVPGQGTHKNHPMNA